MYSQDIKFAVLKEGINSNWQGYSPLTPNAEIAINKSRKTIQHFVHMPSELRMVAFFTCIRWKIAWRGSRVIYSNCHILNVTSNFTFLLGTNFRPKSFYKSAEWWNFSYLLVFKWYYEGELQTLHHEKKWTLKGNFVNNQDLRLEHML